MEIEKKHNKSEKEIPLQKLPGMISLDSITETLRDRNLDLIPKREPLSYGFAGHINLLKCKDKTTGKTINIVEKSFNFRDVKKGEMAKRYWLIENPPSGFMEETRFRLGVVDKETGKVNKVVIDWLYNEEKALENLKGTAGIPKSYGAVYEGLKGSILEQFIEGYDLFDMVNQVNTIEEINNIFDKIKLCYTEAAKKGYIYNSPASSTIMVEKATNQPYLIDWYNHSSGSIESQGPVKEKFEKGLSEIEAERKRFINEFEQEKLAELKAQVK